MYEFVATYENMHTEEKRTSTIRSYNSMFSEELQYKTQNVKGWNLRPDILIHGSPYVM